MRSQQIDRLLTAEEAFWLNPVERWELVEGRVVEVSPVKNRHARILIRLGRHLDQHVETNRLGEVYGGDVGIILKRNPDTVRAPDLAFTRTERLSAVEEETFSEVVPDLVVEILSPSDRWTAVEQKIAEYLAAGVRVIWIVEPSLREVHIYRSPAGMTRETLGESATLVEPELLPGFRLALADFLS